MAWLLMSMLPAAISCRCGFQKCVRAFSISVMCALAALAERCAELRDELEAAGAASHDDDAVQTVRVVGVCQAAVRSCERRCQVTRPNHHRLRPAANTASTAPSAANIAVTSVSRFSTTSLLDRLW